MLRERCTANKIAREISTTPKRIHMMMVALKLSDVVFISRRVAHMGGW
jgi:hypothetical protein